MNIQLAQSERDLRRCYPVMRQLRPHLEEEEFLVRVQRQAESCGYTLAYGEEEGQVRCVAGFRISECLFSGRFLYVDDLVTDAVCRSRGYGDRLFGWLAKKAALEGCAELCLESGVQRHDAHRFYFKQRMHISSYHFTLPLHP